MSLKAYASALIAAIVLALGIKSFVLDVVVVPSPSMEPAILPGDCLLVNKLTYGPLMGGWRVPWFRAPGLRSVGRGDVVVFRFPHFEHREENAARKLFVKRVAGLPGDIADVRNGSLRVNGRMLTDYAVRLSDTVFAALSTPLTIPRRGDLIPLDSGNFACLAALLVQEGHRLDSAGGRITLDGAPHSSYRVRQNYYLVVGDNPDHSFDSRAWGLLAEEAIVGRAEMIYWSYGPAGGAAHSVRWNRILTFIR